MTVHVQTLPDGDVLMSRTEEPFGTVLRFSATEWNQFLAGVAAGEFDTDRMEAS